MLIELYDVALSPQTAGAIEQTGRAAAAAAAAAEISLNAAAATLSSRQRCAVFSHEKKRTKKKKNVAQFCIPRRTRCFCFLSLHCEEISSTPWHSAAGWGCAFVSWINRHK